MFKGFLMTLGHSGFRHGPEENGKTLQKDYFYIVKMVFNVFN